jgi:enamine deaminase RidA (YjgF/YER057c/UK114 family)
MTTTRSADRFDADVPLSAEARAELEALGLDPGAARPVAGVIGAPGRSGIEKEAIRVPDVMNEAYDYALPSSFSRGMRVPLAGATLLVLSGTSAIDDEGRTVHAGDFTAQLLRTFRNLTRLLEAERASWHDVVWTTCYLRDIERDYDTFNRVRTAFYRSCGLDPLPASTGVQARLCRSDLLVEIQATAIVPLRDEPAGTDTA